MNARLTAGIAMLLAGAPATAHRLDEYLQATLVSVDRDRVQAHMRLAPGVAVLPLVLAAIDSNADGVVSQEEARAYAGRVLRDLSFQVDGRRLPPRLLSVAFPPMEMLRQGTGEIEIDWDAAVPPANGPRHLVLENRHQTRIAAYLVNCLAPRDPAIRVQAQRRNYEQSLYRLDYVQAGAPGWGRPAALLAALMTLACARLVFYRRRLPSKLLCRIRT